MVVRNNDIWEKHFPDVVSINAHASDAIFEAIEKVKNKDKSVVGITITAEKGLGKSHVISRIRNQLKADGSALFVYMGQCDNLNQIKSEFLRTLAVSLKQIGSQQVSQGRELATALFNEACDKNFTPQQLLNQFTKALKKKPNVVELLRDKVLAIKPDIDNPDIVTAIFWTLSSNPGNEKFAYNWLAGKTLPQAQADAMGLAHNSDEDKESESLNTVRQILNLISDYKPVVICFDELESVECNNAGFTGQQVLAVLAKDLYDTIKRGIIVSAIYPQTWSSQIKSLPNAEAVIDRTGEKVIDLKHLNSNDVVALVSHWLEDFYKQHQVIPPSSVYPFDENKLRELGKEKLIVRKVLSWCKTNFSLIKPVVSYVESAYSKELKNLDSDIEDYMEDNSIIANALWLGYYTLIGETVENVNIENVIKIDSYAASKDKGYLHYRIDGKENNREVRIGFSVLQKSGGMGVQATLKRLKNYQTFNLTRGCLVRSKQIGKNAIKAQKYLNQLLSPKLGGEWAMLNKQDIKTLLAIYFVWKATEDYELTKEEIVNFIQEKRIAIDNTLIREILSDPSGEVPENAIDEESINFESQFAEIPELVGVGVESLF
ncbi:MAG: AAA family ATPase [Rivularia sp. ALOHA_DT_140]|nr:AAA family ATPase [Rivularia sp. ALOHA_DT_140]